MPLRASTTSAGALMDAPHRKDDDAAAWAVVRRVLPWLLVGRLVNSLLVVTYFNPDEYWQGPEVAHRLVFGYGYTTWEWQPGGRLRGYAHPLVYAAGYKALQLLGLDSAWTCWVLPRLLHGALTAVQDCCVYLLAHRLMGHRAAWWALACHVCSWFVAYCSVRPFSNSLETVLCCAALVFWPLPGKPERPSARGNFAAALALAGAAVVVRPTSGGMWLALGLWHLWDAGRSEVLRVIATRVVPVLAPVLAVSAVIDRWGYGEWVFVPWNFVKFNLLAGHDALYGAYPVHWYFTEGLPVVTTTMLPLVAVGAVVARPAQRNLLWVAAWCVLLFSKASHKEYRFLLPLLPIFAVYAGRGLAAVEEWASRSTHTSHLCRRRAVQGILLLSILVNGGMAFYLGRVHQRGPVAVMESVATTAEKWDAEGRLEDMSVHFWMGCHSTPFYSMVHKRIEMRQLDCSPENALSAAGSQAAQFQNNPEAFLRRLYDGEWAPPSHVVTFDTTIPKIGPIVAEQGLVECGRFSHSFFKHDVHASDDPNDVLLLCREPAAGGAVSA